VKLEALLEAHASELRGFVRAHGGQLLRRESEEDLVQGITLRALERANSFRDRGAAAFRAWLVAVARSYLADRANYWKALRRKPGALLRLTSGGTGGVDPAATATGPSTLAARREHLRLAVQAVAALPPRDRDLVRWTSEDVPIEEQAARLGLSYDAAKQARLRALERFRKAFDLATRRRR
jgi:RNA polymerase sigma factor (sigma-70 family)